MDYKVVIDAGHGGTDSGAVGNGIIEKDLNLQISQLMYQRLQDLNVPVKLIRQTDETINPNDRVKRVLDAFGDSNDVIVVSNHINASGGDGAEVIYALRNNNNLANRVATEIERAGQNVRSVYQRRLPSDPSKDYYFMLRETGQTQPFIMEYGFLDSTKDDVQQLKNNYPQYVDAVVRALLEYMGRKTPAGTYTVKSGDSLWSIAKMFNTTVDTLKTLNNLPSNALQVGQVLRVSVIPSAPEESDIYVVKAGDTLWQIASKYNTTANELLRLNNLTTSSLSIGQQIKVPNTIIIGDDNSNENLIPPDETLYTVKTGDTLWNIASKYNISAEELMKYNDLSSSALSIGQILQIPKKTDEGTEGTAPSDSSYTNYTVKAGDNLWDVASRYNTTVDTLMRYNNLPTNLLSVGQVIRIPNASAITTPTTSEKRYVVKSGDSLYKIASNNNTTVDAITKRNNLKNNNLSIGQTLIIP
ncbi:MAG: LysM peptidoglycan-binding domain-containing protein [Bacilli bacterium]|nr:LysM peptidoglycan-binding domain-containing protein [Bacilli bacterium]